MTEASTSPPQRLFVSGHSLTDPPLPNWLALIAQSRGHPLQWNMQSIPGSAIRVRSRGAGPADAYRHGANREGSNMDVLAEWRAPKTVTGGAYDSLLVTERHGVLSVLAWFDTIEALRSMDQTFAAAARARNANHGPTTTWFYQAWLGIDRLEDPSRWIAYERAASDIWTCIAIKASSTGAQPIQPVPSGVALTQLVELALQGRVAGLTQGPAKQVMQSLFSDDVHLKAPAHYFMAAFLFGWIWAESPVGTAHPPELDAGLARSLQLAAWSSVQSERARLAAPPNLAQCRERLGPAFVQQHWSYVRDHALAHGSASHARAWADWLKRSLSWQRRVRSRDLHPFA